MPLRARGSIRFHPGRARQRPDGPQTGVNVSSVTVTVKSASPVRPSETSRSRRASNPVRSTASGAPSRSPSLRQPVAIREQPGREFVRLVRIDGAGEDAFHATQVHGP
jgi:hypothetical protein